MINYFVLNSNRSFLRFGVCSLSTSVEFDELGVRTDCEGGNSGLLTSSRDASLYRVYVLHLAKYYPNLLNYKQTSLITLF